MAIMKLSDVPEVSKLTGTEKIYINDNGETKQIRGEILSPSRVIWDYDSNYEDFDMEVIVSALEQGKNIWMLRNGQLYQFLSFAMYNFCGPIKTLVGSYLEITESGSQGNGVSMKSVRIGSRAIEEPFVSRLEALGL